MTSAEMEAKCRRFLERVEDCVKSKADNIKSLTMERYGEIVKRLEELSSQPALRRTVADRQLLKRFQLLQVQQLKVLVKRDTRLRVVTLDRLYDTIHAAHLACGHGGRDNTYAEIQHRFANVTKEQITAFVELCDECHAKKRVKGKKVSAPKPPVSNEDNRGRCQVDFIDMQGKYDGEYRYILTYRDQLSKMIFLRATRDNVAEEVAPHLVDIFCEFGAPHLLHSTLGAEFVDKLVKELLKLWPQCQLVRGREALCQSDGHFKRENREIRGRVLCWMRDTRSSRWTAGLRLVQFARNSAVHNRIGRPPFEAVFGAPPKVGLAGAGTGLTSEALDSLATEEELLEAAPARPAEPATNGNKDDGPREPTDKTRIEDRSKCPADCVGTAKATCVACDGQICETNKCRACQLPCHASGDCVAPGSAGDPVTGVLCAICHLRQQIRDDRQGSGNGKRKTLRPPPWDRGGSEMEHTETGVALPPGSKHFRGQRNLPVPQLPAAQEASFHHHHHHPTHHQQLGVTPRQAVSNQPTYPPRSHQFAPCGSERFLVDPREVLQVEFSNLRGLTAGGNGYQQGYNPTGHNGAVPYTEGFACLNNRS